MKIFQSIQKYFATLGIQPLQFDQKYSINVRSLMIWLLMFIPVIDGNIPQFYKAKNFEDYTNGIYDISITIENSYDFGIHIWVAAKLFTFIENFEKIIEKSE